MALPRRAALLLASLFKLVAAVPVSPRPSPPPPPPPIHFLPTAFTFIASQEKSAPKSKCWLKKAGYHRGAEHATGTVSGVVRRE